MKDGNVAIFFPFTGAPYFRLPELKNIIHFRPSYPDESKCLIQYMVKEHGIKKFAFFYQDDAYGTPPMKAAHEQLKKYGITEWLDLPYHRTQVDFKSIAQKLKDFVPEAIGCFSIAFPTEELFDTLGTDYFLGVTPFGISDMSDEIFQRFLSNRGIKFIYSSVVPDPFSSNLEIASLYRSAMKKRGFKYNFTSFESYICAVLFAHVVQNFSPPFSKEKVVKYFEEMKNYSFKGLSLTFNPQTRDLGQPIWIKTLDGQWLNCSNLDG